MNQLCSHTTEMAYFWKKKDVVSYFLSILIFFIHISSFHNYSDTGNTISAINGVASVLIKQCITEFAVPLYFIISGALFFRNYDERKPWAKIKKRIVNLILPYLIWNSVWMLFDILTSYSFLSTYFIGRQRFTITIGNILRAVFLHSCNGPFWYIFDLMFFITLSPLIYSVIRNKSCGLSIVILLLVLNEYGIGLPESLFFDRVAIVYYLIGAMVGKHWFSVFSKKSGKKRQYISLAVLVFTSTYYYLEIAMRMPVPFEFIRIFVHLMAAWAFWNASDLVVESLPSSHVYKSSFLVYATHINVSAVITKILFLLFPGNEYWAIPNFLLTVLLTLSCIYLFRVFLLRYSPRLYMLLTGER